MSQGVQTTATGLEGDAEDGGLIRVEGLRYLGLFSVLTVLKCGRAEGAGAGAPVQLASPQLEETLSRQTSLQKGTGQIQPKADAFAFSCPFRPDLRSGLQPIFREFCLPSVSNQACGGQSPCCPCPVPLRPVYSKVKG